MKIFYFLRIACLIILLIGCRNKKQSLRDSDVLPNFEGVSNPAEVVYLWSSANQTIDVWDTRNGEYLLTYDWKPYFFTMDMIVVHNECYVFCRGRNADHVYRIIALSGDIEEITPYKYIEGIAPVLDEDGDSTHVLINGTNDPDDTAIHMRTRYRLYDPLTGKFGEEEEMSQSLDRFSFVKREAGELFTGRHNVNKNGEDAGIINLTHNTGYSYSELFGLTKTGKMGLTYYPDFVFLNYLGEDGRLFNEGTWAHLYKISSYTPFEATLILQNEDPVSGLYEDEEYYYIFFNAWWSSPGDPHAHYTDLPHPVKVQKRLKEAPFALIKEIVLPSAHTYFIYGSNFYKNGFFWLYFTDGAQVGGDGRKRVYRLDKTLNYTVHTSG